MISVEVEILGKKYRFKHSDPNKVQEYAEFLNKNLDDITKLYKLIDRSDILSLAGMSLTEKLLQSTEENERLKKKISEINEVLSEFFLEVAE